MNVNTFRMKIIIIEMTMKTQNLILAEPALGDNPNPVLRRDALPSSATQFNLAKQKQVPEAGIEPALGDNPNRILSPARLPVPPPGHVFLCK